MVLRCLASNACHVRLNPILESTNPTPERQPPLCLVGASDQARCSIDPSSVEMGAAEGAPCYSGPTGSRTRKVVGIDDLDCWYKRVKPPVDEVTSPAMSCFIRVTSWSFYGWMSVTNDISHSSSQQAYTARQRNLGHA